MNRTQRITYRSVALARIIFIAAAFILSSMYSDSLPKTGLFAGGIDLHFDWWVYLLIIVMYCAFAFVVLFQLVISLLPKYAPALLRHKAVVWPVCIIELLAAAFIGYIAADQVQQYFFPRPKTFLDTLFSPLFPTNESTIIIGKWEAVNCSLMALCSIYFALLIWKYRKQYLAQQMVADADTAAEQ